MRLLRSSARASSTCSSLPSSFALTSLHTPITTVLCVDRLTEGCPGEGGGGGRGRGPRGKDEVILAAGVDTVESGRKGMYLRGGREAGATDCGRWMEAQAEPKQTQAEALTVGSLHPCVCVAGCPELLQVLEWLCSCW